MRETPAKDRSPKRFDEVHVDEGDREKSEAAMMIRKHRIAPVPSSTSASEEDNARTPFTPGKQRYLFSKRLARGKRQERL